MDLKIRDVAELLNISETTVRRWLADGKIPAYRINRQYRFSRCEIEDWLIQQKLEGNFEEESEEQPQKGNMQFSLYRALYRGEVLDGVSGESKEEVIRKTMRHMGQRFDLDPEVLTDLFMDREQMMSTALGHGIAVPHTRDFLLNTHYDVMMVVYPTHPIDYGSLDGEAVHTLFFLFASEDRHHLNLLAKVAHINANEKTRAFFRTKPSKERLLDFVKHWESSLNG
ncbi:MAG: PTS sugar transporter subunit IIA [Chlamydiales bacterium]|nr:PTS sugar transporter subunit IIA [Chlamydiales bacterium]